MPEPIVYVDRSQVRPGRLAEVMAAADGLAQFVEANEPEIISFACSSTGMAPT